jgi:hypothetical protein
MFRQCGFKAGGVVDDKPVLLLRVPAEMREDPCSGLADVRGLGQTLVEVDAGERSVTIVGRGRMVASKARTCLVSEARAELSSWHERMEAESSIWLPQLAWTECGAR